MKTAEKWTRYDQKPPEPNRDVVWLSPSGEEIEGHFAGGLIWYPSGSSMYIYYTPVFWRYR